MQTHRQFRRSAAAYDDAMHYTENDRIPLCSMLSTGFGAGSGSGGHCCGARCFALFRQRQEVSPCSLTGSLVADSPSMSHRLRSSAHWLRQLMLGWYSLTCVRLCCMARRSPQTISKTFRRHFPRASTLVHTLSSSETANIAWSRWAPGDHVPAGLLPVGRFARDMDVLLIGDDGQPVARGEVGEIVVRSRYLANGYWRDPDLTAQRFSADLDGNGTRVACGQATGDGSTSMVCSNILVVRDDRHQDPWLPDRNCSRSNRPSGDFLEFDRVAVVAVGRDKHEPVLVAFVVKTSSASWTASRLRHAMRANLPLHMVPSRIVLFGQPSVQ